MKKEKRKEYSIINTTRGFSSGDERAIVALIT